MNFINKDEITYNNKEKYHLLNNDNDNIQEVQTFMQQIKTYINELCLYILCKTKPTIN